MKHVGLAALISTVILIFVVIVPWRDFQGHSHWDEVGWIPFVSWPVRFRDIAANILLFAPLGVASGYYFRSRVVAAGVIAFFVSLPGEWSQVYSHSRFPSATDLVCNVAGAMAAAWLVGWRARRSAP